MVHIKNRLQIALKLSKIRPRPAVLSRRFPKSDRLLAALNHEPTFRENLEFMQPDIFIVKLHNAIYSAHYAQ
jgi:hypothetical protein